MINFVAYAFFFLCHEALWLGAMNVLGTNGGLGTWITGSFLTFFLFSSVATFVCGRPVDDKK